MTRFLNRTCVAEALADHGERFVRLLARNYELLRLLEPTSSFRGIRRWHPLWVAAHKELTSLARRRAELDGLEGPALLRALRAGVHRHLGFGSFAEYVERLFGYSRRTLDDKLRTAEALEELPALARSLHEGTTPWSAVRELARVATAENEAREVSGGPGDEGKSSYQIAVNVCELCGRGEQDAAGAVIPMDGSIVEMARCDAQHIGRVAPKSTHVGENEMNRYDDAETHVGARARATQSIPPALRRQVMRRDRGRCVVPGCRHATFVDLHHIDARSDGGHTTAKT